MTRRVVRSALSALALTVFLGGQALPAGAQGGERGEVVVRAGDTLWRIAERELGDGRLWSRLAEHNGITAPWRIEPGARLVLPGVAGEPGEAEAEGTGEALRPTQVASASGPPASDAARSDAARSDAARHDAASGAGSRLDDPVDRLAAGLPAGSLGPPPAAPRPAWPDDLRPSGSGAGGALTLEAAIATALTRAPEVRAAEANLERTHALIGVARASALPQVTATGAVRRLETIRAVFPPAVDEVYATGTVTIAQPLFTFGRLSLAIEAAGVEEAAALAALADARSAARFAAESAWLAAVLADRRRDVARSAAEVASRLVERARVREAAGVGTRFDISRAEAEEAAALARVVAAQAESDAARERLATAIGLPAASAFRAEGDLGTGDLPVAPDRAESTCLADRPELALYAHRLRSSELLERYERAQSLPSIDAVASGTWTGHDYITALPPAYGTEQSSVFGGVGVTVPIFDGFRARASAERQAAQTRELAARAERARLEAVREVRGIYHDLGAAREGLVARRAGARAAREALRMAQVAFEAGRATALDVIQASLAVAEAERAEAETAYLYRLGLGRLVRACGSADVVVRNGDVR